MSGIGNTLYMEEQAGLKLVPRTGPCLVRGGLDNQKNILQMPSENWEATVCPLAQQGCEYAKVSEYFESVCSEDYSECLLRGVNNGK